MARTYAGRTIAEARAFLERELTVTEGLWPKAVIDALESNFHGRTLGYSPGHMCRTFPKGGPLDGLRWFY